MDLDFREFNYKEMRFSKNLCNKYPTKYNQ